MPPLKEYMERADERSQEVINAWALNAEAGHAGILTLEFKALADKACFYRHIRKLADNHREHHILSKQVEAEEQEARRTFAEACKAFYEKHAAAH